MKTTIPPARIAISAPPTMFEKEASAALSAGGGAPPAGALVGRAAGMGAAPGVGASGAALIGR